MFVIKDLFPVTEHHCLIIPKAHKIDFMELSTQELMETQVLILQLRGNLQERDPLITGFNIGANCGQSAGQTVFHCHIHLIPRRDGDCIDPKGGVRGVIPEKQKYG